MRIFTILIFNAFFAIPICFGQLADSSLSVKNITKLPVQQYREATDISQNLYNGRIYYVYDARQDEHQFFESRKWIKGSLYYDGQSYDSVQMLYDIVRDEVVIKHFNGDNLLIQPAKVRYFSLLGHRYERMTSGIEIEPGMRTGFYDLLYNGKTKAIVRRTKQRQEKIVDKRVITLFPQKDFYFIFKDGHYHQVHSKKAVFALFPENQKVLKRAFRDSKIRFRKDRENAIARIVALNDQLAKK
jgi:hypothetical protein